MPGANLTPSRIINQRVVAELRVTHFAQAARSSTPFHHHEHGTLCVPARGAARDGFSGRVIELEPGAVIYRPPGERHAHSYGANGMVGLVIEIPASRLQGDLAWASFLRDLKFTANTPALGIVAQLLRELAGTAAADVDIEETCYSLLSVFRPTKESSSHSRGVERVRMCLDDCPTGKISLAELGAIADLHPAYLVNAFRNRYGLSIGAYRRERRVAIALRQLWNTDMELADIAHASGYYDQSHLTNELRRRLQSTPLQIRRLLSTFNSSKTFPPD